MKLQTALLTGCALLLSATLAAAQEKAYIQVKCEPGIHIFLNEEFKGITNSELGGLIVTTEPGQHVLKAVKQDFEPQLFNVSLAKNQVFPVSIKPFRPLTRISQEGAESGGGIKGHSGNLLIQTLPVEAKISIAGQADSDKTKDKWLVENLPVGSHAVTVSGMNKQVRCTAEIEKEQTTHLFINLLDGTVRDINAEERARIKAEQEKREKEQAEKLRLQEQERAELRRREEQERAEREGRFEQIRKRGWTNSLGMIFVPVEGTNVLFCIWETRVKDYAAYANANGGVDGSWKNPEYKKQKVTPTEDCPVVNVSWEDARAFCDWLTKKDRDAGKIPRDAYYRLPTDAEWSVAVGLGREDGNSPKDKDGNIKDVYPWGKEFPPPNGAGNFADISAKAKFTDFPIIEGYRDGFATTAPVGSFNANKFGIFDLSGNVWEWCEDKYNPSGSARVLRGGSWDGGDPRGLLSSLRSGVEPESRGLNFGFRVVLVGGR
jgi:hypothetical protein